MSEFPRGYVPLPQIESHTDEIIFKSLGFPIGFDEKRLGVNLRAIRRIQTLGALGDISIIGFDGQMTKPNINVIGNHNGAGIAGASGSRAIQPLAEVDDITGNNSPPVRIKINNTELALRINNDTRFRRGPLDPAAQAKYLNQGLQHGLHDSVKQRLITGKGIYDAGIFYPAWLSVWVLILHNPLQESVIPSIIAGSAVNLWQNSGKFPFDKEDAEKSFHSLFTGVPLDRVFATGVLTKARLIKQIT